MHGGLIMTLADELAAWTILGVLGKFGFTAELKARLRKPVKIGAEVTGSGTITRPGSRVVVVKAELEQAGQRVFDGEVGFVLVDASGAERLLGAPLPSGWKQFCR
jgi:acyl-coenzyme A thioesterase PaaI-like protein